MPDLGTRTCLLIEDDEDDREFFEIAMSELKVPWKLHKVSNGLEAFRILRERTLVPDMIFVDATMPTMTGLECLIEIRKIPHMKDVTIYMITHSHELRNIEAYHQHSIAGVVQKPARISELVRLLQDIFS